MKSARPQRSSRPAAPEIPGDQQRPVAILDRWPNFRDLSAAATSTERYVHPGRFYRAPALTALTPDEKSVVESLDPAVIVDFRSPAEVDAHPVDLPATLSARRHHLPLPPLVDEQVDRFVRAPGVRHHDVSSAIAARYRHLMHAHGNVYQRFLQAIAGVRGRPVIFHCTAGKDRTGLAAALILGALGATMDAIESDYLATAQLWHPDPELEGLLPVVARPAVFGVESMYLVAALRELGESHGGASAFAEAALGSDGYRNWKARHACTRT